MDSFSSPSTKPLYRGTQIVWYLLGIIETLLALRFILKLFGANPGAIFTDFVYNASYVFTAPFVAVFRTSQVSGSIFEWTTILGMLIYWLLAYGIIKLLLISKTVSTPEAASKLKDQEKNN
ncbi:YggT family protein [Candidatus Falkowbacteria bacterium]|nr:YggT family protein [Candidatus Falkowbacteria bacterium]